MPEAVFLIGQLMTNRKKKGHDNHYAKVVTTQEYFVLTLILAF